MAVPQLKVDTYQSLLARLGEARTRTDPLFHLVRPEALYDRAIPERHRLIFYLGHLETSTPFAPLPGFRPFPFYPGYSTDFFEGRHYVAKGGSPRTAACMLRRSFRNWFQPRYPYVYAKFRCVEN